MHLSDQSHVLLGAQLPLPFQKKKCPFRYILRFQCPSTFIPYEPTTATTFQKAPFSPFPFFIRERRVLEEAVFFTTPRPNVVEFTGYLESSWENRGAAYAQRVHIVCALCAHCVCMHITCQRPSTCTIKYSTKPPCQRGITCTILSQWPSTCTKKSHQIKSPCDWGTTCII
jgi:hypothetical protein